MTSESDRKIMWQLVNWLTHTSDATRVDSEVAIDATQNVLSAFGHVVIKQDAGVPSRCPNCGSYQLSACFASELSPMPPYVVACEKCDQFRAAERQDEGVSVTDQT
jgi:hypothetical protein